MNNRPVIVFPDADPAEKGLLDALFHRLENIGEFRLYYGKPDTTAAYVNRIKDANAVLLGWDMPAEVMKAAEQLQIISFSGIGVAKFVDLDEAKKRSVVVSNCPGYSDSTVAEQAMALLLGVSRKLNLLDQKLRGGDWCQSLEGMELSGKTIGLIGFGGIARKFAKMCRAFEMEVLVWNRTHYPELAESYDIQFCDFDELIAQSDIVSLHLAVNSETTKIIDQPAFKRMRQGAILINTARAELVDESAMMVALGDKRISAGLDVFHLEPLPENHPLLKMENVVLSPHVGYNTPESVFRLLDIAVRNIESYYAGKPQNVVRAD